MISLARLMQQCAGLRWLDATRVAREQGDAEPLLELPDLHAERGLSHVQLLGRARHVAGLDHADEVPELAQIYRGSIFSDQAAIPRSWPCGASLRHHAR